MLMAEQIGNILQIPASPEIDLKTFIADIKKYVFEGDVAQFLLIWHIQGPQTAAISHAPQNVKNFIFPQFQSGQIEFP